MTTSLLLKYARARDDRDLVWRINAAMMVCAQERDQASAPEASRSLIGYVLQNPMTPVPLMINHVSTSPVVAASMTIENNTIDTSAVPDNDILTVVTDKWDAVAAAMFPAETSVA